MVRWSKPGLLVSMVALALAACGGGGGNESGDFNRLMIPAQPAQAIERALIGPFGLTFDRAGYLYIGSTDGSITRVSPSGDR